MGTPIPLVVIAAFALVSLVGAMEDLTSGTPVFEYVNCRVDYHTDDSVAVVRYEKLVDNTSMTHELCAEHCVTGFEAERYSHFVITRGDECSCGYANYVNGAEETCTARCSGDPSQECGDDAGFLSIFRIFREAPLPIVVGDPPLWELFTGVGNRVRWVDAHERCAARSARLLVIDSAELNTKVYEYLLDMGLPANGHDYSVWIDGTDRDNEGVFQWERTSAVFWNNSAEVPGAFVNWGDGEPNNFLPDDEPAHPGEDCVELDLEKGGRWNDLECDGVHYRGYVCEVVPLKTRAMSAVPLSWYDARDYCSDRNARIVSVHNAEEAADLHTFAQAYGWVSTEGMWIGLRETSEGVYEWHDGSFDTTYRNWADGEPQTDQEREDTGVAEECVFLWTNRLWGDDDCSEERYFACDPVTPFPGVTLPPTGVPSPAVTAMPTPVPSLCFDDRVQDGRCDAHNNKEACDYDGGDCCVETCREDLGPCGSGGEMDCIDPNNCLSCVYEHPQKGCEVTDIAQCVCDRRPSCCSDKWTLECVVEVFDRCQPGCHKPGCFEQPDRTVQSWTPTGAYPTSKVNASKYECCALCSEDPECIAAIYSHADRTCSMAADWEGEKFMSSGVTFIESRPSYTTPFASFTPVGSTDPTPTRETDDGAATESVSGGFELTNGRKAAIAAASCILLVVTCAALLYFVMRRRRKRVGTPAGAAGAEVAAAEAEAAQPGAYAHANAPELSVSVSASKSLSRDKSHIELLALRRNTVSEIGDSRLSVSDQCEEGEGVFDKHVASSLSSYPCDRPEASRSYSVSSFSVSRSAHAHDDPSRKQLSAARRTHKNATFDDSKTSTDIGLHFNGPAAAVNAPAAADSDKRVPLLQSTKYFETDERSIRWGDDLFELYSDYGSDDSDDPDLEWVDAADTSIKLDTCDSLRQSLLPHPDSGSDCDNDDEENRFAHRKIEVDVPLKQGDVFVPPGGDMPSSDASSPPPSEQSPVSGEAKPGDALGVSAPPGEGDLAAKRQKPKRKRIRKQCRCTHPGCGALIRGSSNLLAHMREKHDKIRLYRCPVCEKSFSRKFNLDVHIRTHADQRKHACHLCDESFTQKSNLKRHMFRKHEKPLKCPKCNERFANPEEAGIHFRAAHPEEMPRKLFIRKARSTSKHPLRRCDRCNTKFSSPEDLRRHHATCNGIPPEIPITVPDPRKPPPPGGQSAASSMVLGTVISDGGGDVDGDGDDSPSMAPMEVVHDELDMSMFQDHESVVKEESTGGGSPQYDPSDFVHPAENPPAYEAPVVVSIKEDVTDFSPVKKRADSENDSNASSHPQQKQYLSVSCDNSQKQDAQRNSSLSTSSPSPSPERGDSDGASPENSQQRSDVRSASSSSSHSPCAGPVDAAQQSVPQQPSTPAAATGSPTSAAPPQATTVAAAEAADRVRHSPSSEQAAGVSARGTAHRTVATHASDDHEQTSKSRINSPTTSHSQGNQTLAQSSARSVDRSFFGVGQFTNTAIMHSPRVSLSARPPSPIQQQQRSNPQPQMQPQLLSPNGHDTKPSPYTELLTRRRSSLSRDGSATAQWQSNPKREHEHQSPPNVVIRDPTTSSPITKSTPVERGRDELRGRFGAVRSSGTTSLQRTLSHPATGHAHPPLDAVSGARSPNFSDHPHLTGVHTHTPSAGANEHGALSAGFSVPMQSSAVHRSANSGQTHMRVDSTFTPQFDSHSILTHAHTPTAAHVPAAGASRSLSPESAVGSSSPTPSEFLVSLLQTPTGRQFLQTPEGQRVFQEQLLLHEARSSVVSPTPREQPPPYSEGDFGGHYTAAAQAPQDARRRDPTAVPWPITDPRRSSSFSSASGHSMAAAPLGLGERSPYSRRELHVHNTINVTHNQRSPPPPRRQHSLGGGGLGGDDEGGDSAYEALVAQQLLRHRDEQKAISLLKRLRKHYDDRDLFPLSVNSVVAEGSDSPRLGANADPQSASSNVSWKTPMMLVDSVSGDTSRSRSPLTHDQHHRSDQRASMSASASNSSASRSPPRQLFDHGRPQTMPRPVDQRSLAAAAAAPQLLTPVGASGMFDAATTTRSPRSDAAVAAGMLSPTVTAREELEQAVANGEPIASALVRQYLLDSQHQGQGPGRQRDVSAAQQQRVTYGADTVGSSSSSSSSSSGMTASAARLNAVPARAHAGVVGNPHAGPYQGGASAQQVSGPPNTRPDRSQFPDFNAESRFADPTLPAHDQIHGHGGISSLPIEQQRALLLHLQSLEGVTTHVHVSSPHAIHQGHMSEDFRMPETSQRHKRSHIGNFDHSRSPPQTNAHLIDQRGASFNRSLPVDPVAAQMSARSPNAGNTAAMDLERRNERAHLECVRNQSPSTKAFDPPHSAMIRMPNEGPAQPKSSRSHLTYSSFADLINSRASPGPSPRARTPVSMTAAAAAAATGAAFAVPSSRDPRAHKSNSISGGHGPPTMVDSRHSSSAVDMGSRMGGTHDAHQHQLQHHHSASSSVATSFSMTSVQAPMSPVRAAASAASRSSLLAGGAAVATGAQMDLHMAPERMSPSLGGRSVQSINSDGMPHGGGANGFVPPTSDNSDLLQDHDLLLLHGDLLLSDPSASSSASGAMDDELAFAIAASSSSMAATLSR